MGNRAQFRVTRSGPAPRETSGYLVYKPDDTLTWISINSEPAFEVDGTTLGGVVASFEDITERRPLEEALRQASSELAALRGTAVSRSRTL